METEEHTLPAGAGKRYVDVELVGEGGMGQTFRARDTLTGRNVAIKVIRPELCGDDALRKRFKREVRALAGLDHPNVVRLYDFHDGEQSLFFTMEYLDGKTLGELVKGKLPAVGDTVRWFTGLASALAAIHDRSILHRDIKPANIIVTRKGLAKFVDFGLAKSFEEQAQTAVTKTNQIVGTLLYLPPEVLSGHPFDARGDLYQLGLALYVALTGRHPFPGAAFAGLASGATAVSVPAPSSLNPAVDPALDALVLRAMAVEPHLRFSGATQLLDALSSWQDGTGGQEAPAPSGSSSPGAATLPRGLPRPGAETTRPITRPRSIGPVVLLALVLVGLLAGAFLALRGRGREPSQSQLPNEPLDLQDGEMKAIGALVFHLDTLPAVVGMLEHGNRGQMRSAWLGLRALVDGTASTWYIDDLGDDFDFEAYRKKALAFLSEPQWFKRIEAAFERLPPPSRRHFRQTVEQIGESDEAARPAVPVPRQLSPADGTVFDHYPRTTTLRWARLADTRCHYTYEVQVDFAFDEESTWASDGGTSYIFLKNLGKSEHTFDFVGAQPGRWRVRAVVTTRPSDEETTGAWSPWWTFSYTR